MGGKISKSNEGRGEWEFRVMPCGASFTVEFKCPWNPRWEPTSAWSTEAIAHEAMLFYRKNIGKLNLPA